ncbi:putative sodium-coupled neutral amino acid transporter 10 isoform X1 [Centruroides vittatus]|uniref:putative sodium-coupled neutral amino acid transporter 10 isoform X1 n=2 Tax=Centruroides vittatus TaxID=120091 RepID=UPI00350F65F3
MDIDAGDFNTSPAMSTITCMCLRSVINLGNSIIGVSILAMPYCFKKCGILLSILLIIASGLITRAACHLLLKSAIMARRRNFEFLAFHTFGPTGKLVVEIGIIGFLIGVCVAFFVVVGDLSPALIAKFLMVENTSQLRAEILIFLGLFVAFPLGLLRKVDSLTSFSAMSIGFYMFLILIIVGEALPKLLAGSWWNQVNWWQPAGLLPSLPIFSMALSCQTQLFEFFDPLNDPSLKKMNSVINGAVQMCLAVYISVGFFGYIAFHDSPISGNILIRLTPSLTAEVIKVGFILSVVISFPLCLFPCRSSLHSLIFKQGMGHYDLQSSYMPDHRFRVLTCALVTATMATAIMVPNIEFVLGLLGSTIGITICVILPALIFLHLTTKNTNERRMAQLVTFIGFFILIACTFSTLNENKTQEVASQLKPKIENEEIKKDTKPIENKMFDSLNKDKEVKNQEMIDSKQIVKEVAQNVKEEKKDKASSENKRQEPPVPQESEKNMVKPIIDKSLKSQDALDPEALKKEDKEINSQKKQEEKEEKKNEKNLKKEEELLKKLEAQHIEQKKILEEQKKLLEELKMHKETHDEQKAKVNEPAPVIKEQQVQPSENINKVVKVSPDSFVQNIQPVANIKLVQEPLKRPEEQSVKLQQQNLPNQNLLPEQKNVEQKHNIIVKEPMIKTVDIKPENKPELVARSQEPSFVKQQIQLETKPEQKILQPDTYIVNNNIQQLYTKEPGELLDQNAQVLKDGLQQINKKYLKIPEESNILENNKEIERAKNILSKPIPFLNQNNVPKLDKIPKDQDRVQSLDDAQNKTLNNKERIIEIKNNQESLKKKREVETSENELQNKQIAEDGKAVDRAPVESENADAAQKQNVKPEVSSAASPLKHEMRRLLFHNR